MTETGTPIAPPMRPAGDDGPEGIGGWLILPIVQLVLNSALIVYEIAIGFMQGAGPDQGLPDLPAPTEAGPAIRALFDNVAGMSAGEKSAVGFLFFGIFIVGYATFALIEFLQKKRYVPALMIGFYLLLTGLTAGNYFLIVTFPELVQTPDDATEAIMAIVRMAVAIAIWIPYFLVSKRVNNTFVR